MVNHNDTSVVETIIPDSGSHPSPSRMVIYSPDTYGLGHISRCLKVSEAIKSVCPELSILLITGSPVAGRYPIHEGLDLVGLPAVVKVADSRYEPRTLGVSRWEMLELRQNIIFEAVRTFDPHLVLIDHSPVGVMGELRKTLCWLKEKRPECHIALGLRDIIDEADKVLADWGSENIHQVLEEVYDQVFIFGTPEVFDPISAYRFGPTARAKTSYTGFITKSNRAATVGPAIHRAPNLKAVFVTVGGGEDGAEIIETYLRMASRHRDRLHARTTIVTGPFFSARSKGVFARVAEALQVEFKEFMPDISPHLRSADLVISMRGYNTVKELLASGRKALIIPRVHPRKEQLIRSKRLAEMGLLSYINPQELTPLLLYEAVSSLLESDDQPLVEARLKNTLPLDGGARLASMCAPILNAPVAVR